MADILELAPISVVQAAVMGATPPGGGVDWEDSGDFLLSNLLVIDDFEGLGLVTSLADLDFSNHIFYAYTITEEMLPDTRRILGFQLIGGGYADQYPIAAIDQVRVFRTGALGTFQSYGEFLPTEPATDSILFGDGTSKWGWDAVTPADVRHASFRLCWRVGFFGTSQYVSAYVDGITLRIYHEPILHYTRGATADLTVTAGATRLASYGRAASASVGVEAGASRLTGYVRAVSASITASATAGRVAGYVRSASASITVSASAAATAVIGGIRHAIVRFNRLFGKGIGP